jgi:glycosyltransferase involved in cell wall biosynthesis
MSFQSAIPALSEVEGSNPHSAIPEVSVVIASHRTDFLGELLKALTSAQVRTVRFEVIAVCDYPTGRMNADFPTVIFHQVNNRSISAKRNIGVRNASAEIVAFIDDDCIPSPEWIASGFMYFTVHPECAAVEGLTTIENSAYAPPSLRDYRRLERPGFRTNNIFYRKQAFLGVGGFDERFTVQREDIDLAFSMLDKGYIINYDITIRVMHRVRYGEPWDLLKNCINRRFDPLLFKKHPARYREHIKSPFPPSLLMLLGFHVALVVCLLFGVPFFAAACIADLAAVTVLAVRRGGKGPVKAMIPEWISCCLAPLALLGALALGSVRYRKLFLI